MKLSIVPLFALLAACSQTRSFDDELFDRPAVEASLPSVDDADLALLSFDEAGDAVTNACLTSDNDARTCGDDVVPYWLRVRCRGVSCTAETGIADIYACSGGYSGIPQVCKYEYSYCSTHCW